MARFNLAHFANPEILKTIRPDHLLRLLSPHRSYFDGRGVEIRMPNANMVAEKGVAYGASATSEEDPIDFEALGRALASPDDEMPRGLVDALYTIQEMATTDGMEELLRTAGTHLDPTQDQTPADVAVQVWLKAPHLLVRAHAEQSVAERRSFYYYRPKTAPETALPTADGIIKNLERELGGWFLEKKKSGAVRIFAHAQGDEVWFRTWHGDGYRREGALRDGKSSCVYFRPEKHDLVIYNHVSGELRINAATKGEREFYRYAFGLHFFGDGERFPEISNKFTLAPLQSDGKASLVVSDIHGLDSIELTDFGYLKGGAQNRMDIHKGEDLFAAFEEEGSKIETHPIVHARFRVTSSDSPKPRTVRIQLPNVAVFTRDEDGRKIEEWLSKRGFSLTGPEGADATAEAVACA